LFDTNKQKVLIAGIPVKIQSKPIKKLMKVGHLHPGMGSSCLCLFKPGHLRPKGIGFRKIEVMWNVTSLNIIHTPKIFL